MMLCRYIILYRFDWWVRESKNLWFLILKVLKNVDEAKMIEMLSNLQPEGFLWLSFCDLVSQGHDIVTRKF